MRYHLVLAGLLALLTADVLGDAAPTVQVDVQMVALPPADALRLIPALKRESSRPAALEQVARMIEQEQAELLHWPVATAVSGSSADNNSGEEVKYPTEFDPPMFPMRFNITPPEYTLYPPHASRLWATITPTAFEGREVGPRLEIQPVVSQGGNHVALSLIVRDTRFVALHEFAGATTANGISGVMVQPEFAVSHFTGNLTVAAGKRVLLANFISRGEKPRAILFLLRATVIPAPTPLPQR